MTAPKAPQKAYIIKITLDGLKPPVWRRFSVPAEITLDRLHDVLQIVMGWQETHLHCFKINGTRYMEEAREAEVEAMDERECRLCDLVGKVKSRFTYEYDFGDGWEHTLIVEQIHDVPEGHIACVACLAGKRCCPPEDVGGIHGYPEFLQALSDPTHPEHKAYLKWCGGSFDPEEFNPRAVDLELAKYARWSRPRRVKQEMRAG